MPGVAFIVSTILLSVLALTSAQTIPALVASLPPCSILCLNTAIISAGCRFNDFACQCGPARGTISQSATPCVAKSLTNNATDAQNITSQICALAVTSSSVTASTSAASATSSMPPSSSNATTSKGKSRAGAVAGGVIGGLIAAFSGVAAILLALRYKKRKKGTVAISVIDGGRREKNEGPDILETNDNIVELEGGGGNVDWGGGNAARENVHNVHDNGVENTYTSYQARESRGEIVAELPAPERNNGIMQWGYLWRTKLYI
ncbi:uncharacterized protein PAC_13006 [Phialocephala subalpina]|uniref:CFEM domain-containing protein n=1 Tax=Phialocephala subalpina TaxID=576137 RepID=A0A1L7XDI5_9HELO|nr:uncharacterized protein PAC_13006 [Phialocephala subalpina]